MITSKLPKKTIKFQESCDASMITLNIDKIKSNMQILGRNPIEQAIYAYYNYCDCNDYGNLKCPCCGNKSLTFHKKYERNLTYYYNKEVINIIINITVYKCNHCSNIPGRQKYHAILPEFILPYAIYEASTIMKSLNDYYNGVKLNQILDKLKIVHKLFYDWIHKMLKYVFPSSIILEIKDEIKGVVLAIMETKSTFLTNFYNNYRHPFFLFRVTCVPLCITP